MKIEIRDLHAIEPENYPGPAFDVILTGDNLEIFSDEIFLDHQAAISFLAKWAVFGHLQRSIKAGYLY